MDPRFKWVVGMIVKKPHKFKVGDEVIVREPTKEDIKDFDAILFDLSGQGCKIKQFTIRELRNGYKSGNPYYIGDDFRKPDSEKSWFPECLLSLKCPEIPIKKVKIKIGSEEFTVAEPIANLINKDNGK